MVDVTLDTLSNSATTFIRDVLRHNLTDPLSRSSNWIFNSRPEEKEINPPMVLITCDSAGLSKLTMDGSNPKVSPPEITFDIRVWARKIRHRDQIGDEIISTLIDPTKSDGSKTVKENKLVFKSMSEHNEDGFIAGFPKVLRIKRIMATFVYTGD